MASKAAPARTAKRKAKAKPAKARPALEFNHAMIYTTDYPRALRFYRDLLGFSMIEEYPGGYGRLQSPGGKTTIALHVLDRGQQMETAREGLRLYFEVKQLDALCEQLVDQGVRFDQLPKDMPWGWRHAYLHDPDGHELSLYWAGRRRFENTMG